MICFLPSLLDPSGGKDATLEQVVEHIVYAGNRIGYSHVGIGSDFDGMLNGPKGLDDVTQYPQLASALAKRGLSGEELRQVLGLNILRVLREVEETAKRRRRKKSVVLFDNVHQVWNEEQRSILVEVGSSRKMSSRA